MTSSLSQNLEMDGRGKGVEGTPLKKPYSESHAYTHTGFMGKQKSAGDLYR